MWMLRAERERKPLTFRLRAGAVKTVGRAPRADFIINAATVSLTETISSLKNLSQIVRSDDEEKLADAIAKAVKTWTP